MRDTYRALLKGDRLEWSEVVPSGLATEQPVEVTILNKPDQIVIRRQRMAKAFDDLAAIDAFSEISDPSDWQREVRKDRPLPGREI